MIIRRKRFSAINAVFNTMSLAGSVSAGKEAKQNDAAHKQSMQQAAENNKQLVEQLNKVAKG